MQFIPPQIKTLFDKNLQKIAAKKVLTFKNCWAET